MVAVIGLLLFMRTTGPTPPGEIPLFDFTGGREELRLTLLHTNDEHSALLPHSQATGYGPEEEVPVIGGSSRLATAVAQLRGEKEAQEEPVLLVSAGDFLGGSPYAWLALQGFAPEINIMQEIGYDVVTLGNHEFDFGADVLARYLMAAGYPEAGEKTALVATNTNVPAVHPLADVGLERTRLVELENGLKVGFLGLLGRGAQAVIADHSPVTFSAPTEAAREAVAELREQEADIIIAITHSGVREDRLLAQNVPGIDIIVGGHSHTALEEPLWVGGTYIVQAGALLSHLGVLEIGFDPERSSVRLLNEETGRPYLIPLDGVFPLHPDIEPSLFEYTEELDRFVQELTRDAFGHIMDPVAYSAFALPGESAMRETTFGNFVTDAMRMVVEEKTGEEVHFALQTNGQIRGALIPGKLEYPPEGITFYDLAVTSGLGRGPDGRPGYPLVSVHFRGDEIRRLLEFSSYLAQFRGNSYFLQVSGLRFDFDLNRSVLFTVPFLELPVPSLQGVRNVEVYEGMGFQLPQDELYSPLESDKLYHVVTSSRLINSLLSVRSMVPDFLGVVPRDGQGRPISEIGEAVIQIEGEALKVWEVLAHYAAAQPALPGNGTPWIPDYYAYPSGRIYQD